MKPMIFFELARITIIPTATIMDFAEILLDTLAAMGDAMALPKTKPETTYQCKLSSMVIKVRELINAMKNLLNFTEPNENLACLPPAISEERTIVPQPPPPTASINPPKNPRDLILVIFLDLTLCFALCLAKKAFLKIKIPKQKVYIEITGLV